MRRAALALIALICAGTAHAGEFYEDPLLLDARLEVFPSFESYAAHEAPTAVIELGEQAWTFNRRVFTGHSFGVAFDRDFAAEGLRWNLELVVEEAVGEGMRPSPCGYGCDIVFRDHGRMQGILAAGGYVGRPAFGFRDMRGTPMADTAHHRVVVPVYKVRGHGLDVAPGPVRRDDFFDRALHATTRLEVYDSLASYYAGVAAPTTVITLPAELWTPDLLSDTDRGRKASYARPFAVEGLTWQFDFTIDAAYDADGNDLFTVHVDDHQTLDGELTVGRIHSWQGRGAVTFQQLHGSPLVDTARGRIVVPVYGFWSAGS